MIMPSNIDGSDNFDTSAGGIVLQTRYVVFDQLSSHYLHSNAIYKFDELKVIITPKSVNSVFKLELCLPHEMTSTGNDHDVMFSAYRNSHYIGVVDGVKNSGIATRCLNKFGTDTASTMEHASYVYVDAPATTEQIIYTPTARTPHAQSLYLNGTAAGGQEAWHERGISTFIVTELSGD